MIIKVNMLAFENSKPGHIVVREVEIPDKEFNAANQNGKLELTFRYGQNDFQPQRRCSVSVADVIELDGKLYMVMASGFKEISQEEFDDFLKMDRRERIFAGEWDNLYAHDV